MSCVALTLTLAMVCRWNLIPTSHLLANRQKEKYYKAEANGQMLISSR